MNKRYKIFDVHYEVTGEDGGSFTTSKTVKAIDEEHAEELIMESTYPSAFDEQDWGRIEMLKSTVNVFSIETL